MYQRGAVTGAPVAGWRRKLLFARAAQRPSSTPRGLPASILRAFCQVRTGCTLLVKADLQSGCKGAELSLCIFYL